MAHRRRTAVVVLAAVALGLSGCSQLPKGADGNLLNNWAALPDPVLPMPAAGQCFDNNGGEPRDYGWEDPASCTEKHDSETVYVGTVTGGDASRQSPPAAGSAARRTAYEQCAGKAKEFLGADWRTGFLYLSVVFPESKHWSGGARWFRCDLLQLDPDDNVDDTKSRTTSLKGALATDSDLRLRCFSVKESAGSIDSMPPVDCGQSHQAEFVGVVDLPEGPYPNDDKSADKVVESRCYAAIAAYAGLPNDGNLKYRTGWITNGYNKEDWDRGNRGIRCYFYRQKPVSRSIKGAGTAGLPIQYA